MKPKYAFVLAGVIALALFIIFTGYTSILSNNSSGTSIVRTNTKLKAFTATTPLGDPYVAPKNEGVVVYEAFASWCLPCRQSVPEAISFAKNHPDVPVIGIAYRDVSFEIAKFEKKYGSFESTIKSTGQIEKSFGLKSIPQTLFVVNGTIRYRLYGSPSEEDLDNVLSLVEGELAGSKDR